MVIGVKERSAEILVTKIEAARRQIDAAIRMVLNREDELAVHTVAAAAYRILRDLLDKRGRSDFEELIQHGIYAYAYSIASGQFSEEEIDNLKHDHPQLFPIITSLAARIGKEGDRITPADVSVLVDQASKKLDWQSSSQAANFLKHADRDDAKAISIEEIDNLSLIARASAAYTMITRDATFEMVAFWIWRAACSDTWQIDLKDESLAIAKALASLPPGRRRLACKALIQSWRKTYRL